MAIWKEAQSPKKEATPMSPPPAPSSESAFKHTETSMDSIPTPSPVTNTTRRTAHRGEPAESIIASDITIEGKIEGAGHIRLAGRFKGDVHIQGDLTIDVGAKLTGSVRANTVIISGEVEGNIESAQRVELLDSGVLNGDLKAGTVTFAAGSRMRGRAEFGWGDEGQSSQSRPGLTLGTTSLAS
jgi:cytoskeletal protein CcmA (bactofilin family)